MPPSRVTTSPRPSSRRSERFCLDLPRASSGAASLVESTQVAKFVMSRATDEVSTPYSATIFAATLLLISARCSAEIWFIASQKRRWSSFAALILVNRGPAVLTHQLEICAFEHGATTRFSAAMTRNLPTDTPLTGAAPATTSSMICATPVSYTHLRAHETKANLVCRLLLEKKKKKTKTKKTTTQQIK